MAKPRVGAQLYSLREFLKTEQDVAVTFKKVAAIGYTSVQFSGIGPVDPAKLGQLAKDNGLSVDATHISWDRCLNDLDGLISEHKLWNCPHMAIGGLPGAYFSEAGGLKKFVQEVTAVGQRLEKEGMDFSYHNHNHEFVRYGNKTWLAALYEMTDPRWLKVEIDTYWVQAGGGDPTEWIAKYPGRMPLLHLKDMCVVPKAEQRFAEVGEGNLNWKSILAAAEKSGVKHLLVEQDNCYGRDPFESMAISYRNLKSWGYQ